MAVYKDKLGYYIRGKIKKDDGSYYNYKRKAIGATSTRQARDFETDFLRQYQDIELAKTQKSFQEAAEEFILTDKNLKQSSIRSKKGVLFRAYECFGNKKINLITVDMLRKAFADLESKYSRNYVSKIYYAVNEVFDFCVLEGRLQVNPLKRVKLTLQKDDVKKEMDFWEPEQFQTFISCAEDEKARVFFMILFYMGLRKGEAQVLQWKDVDLKKRVLHISKTFTTVPNGYAITSPKTQNSVRNISIPRNLIDALKHWKDEQREIYGFNEECYVFGFYRPMGRTTIKRYFDDIYEKAHEKDAVLPKIRIHDLRHSHASYLINNMSDKFTDFDVAKRLGDTVETLHSTYAHWFKQADKAIIEVMDGQPVRDDTIARLKELKGLLDSEIITPEEFSKLKAKIIG